MSSLDEDALDKEIKAFEQMKTQLFEHHFGKFVIIHQEKLDGAYDTFDNAAKEAIKRYGKGPYLIRKVIDDEIKIPVSLAYRSVHAIN